ncbi:MAG: hypothetical protein JXM70_21845 [Pirellulales bacterium]|nr:hypothetical protein [Pirellulales bacterium]
MNLTSLISLAFVFAVAFSGLATARATEPIEIDSESGAEIYVLGGDARPADNIYGEQPYGDATGRRIAIRYYPLPNKPGGINILDLEDGSNREIFSGSPPFPAFHAWGEWLYYAQTVEGRKMLRRCNYLTLEVENVAELPPDRGSYSYGTVSPDNRYYAVSVRPPKGGSSQVHLLDMRKNRWSVLLDKPGYYPKHEQFSRDGRNRVLIQLNKMPDAKVVCFSRTEYDGKQWSHAHPYLTANNKWLVFGARRNAHPQVHGAKLKDGWLQTF